MIDLLIIVGAELTVLFSVAAMNIYRLRTDVLTGPYIQRAADQSAGVDMRVLAGQPQTEWPPGLGDGVCRNESILIQEPPVVGESPGLNSPEMPIADRISALTMLAASIGFNERNVFPLKDTAGSMSADDGLEPNSPMASDQNAIASNVAWTSSDQGTIRSDPTVHVPTKIRA
jgi:hypothetical protein